ncbi:MAG: peptidoglycan-binding domain-containing protein [bacterium]|nr:peptidoglycan-binding domain-containing protein [bacterium]
MVISSPKQISVERTELNDQLKWVQNQVKSELNKLQQGINDQQKITSFYEKNEKGGYDFNVDMVQKYLQSIQNKSLAELMKRNSAAWAMAVQIALKIHGYDTGKIDGIFASKGKIRESKTLAVVRAFQEANGIVGERGWPGSQTIKKLIEGLHLKKVEEIKVVQPPKEAGVQPKISTPDIVVPPVTGENPTSTTSPVHEQTPVVEQTGNN